MNDQVLLFLVSILDTPNKIFTEISNTANAVAKVKMYAELNRDLSIDDKLSLFFQIISIAISVINVLTVIYSKLPPSTQYQLAAIKKYLTGIQKILSTVGEFVIEVRRYLDPERTIGDNLSLLDKIISAAIKIADDLVAIGLKIPPAIQDQLARIKKYFDFVKGAIEFIQYPEC